MKIADLRKKSQKDLDKQAIKLREDIREFVREKATSNAKKNKHELRVMKKDLAKILTVENEMKAETVADKESK